jgi:hypothetical protein
MIRSRRLLIVLSAVVLVLSLLAGLAAATTGFFGLALDRAVEEVEERNSYHEGPVAPVDPKPGKEQSLVTVSSSERGSKRFEFKRTD